MSDLVYLYGFVPPGVDPPPGLTGVADSPIQGIDIGGVRAIVSGLPETQYSAAVIEARLQDLAWVGEQGLAHERVVTWFADHADVLPAPLFSLHSSRGSLEGAVRPRLRALEQAMHSVATRREWNLKVAYETDRIAQHGAELSEALRAADVEIEAAPPGRRYLLQKKRGELLKQEISRMARSAADDMLRELAQHAEASIVLPIASADREGTVVLNAALLVARAAEPALRAEAERLYDRYTNLGFIVSFSGPWAPYRFVEQNVQP